MVDIRRLKEVIDGTELPDWVQDRRVELFEDSTGDEAARIQLIVRDDRDDVLENAGALDRARVAVHQAFRRSELRIWPYVRFVIASEAA